MTKLQLILPAFMIIAACNNDSHTINISTNVMPVKYSGILHPDGSTLASRFAPPQGYSRPTAASDSYTTFLRALPLKADGEPVHYYDGTIKENNGIYAAVLNMDIGHKDLLQCADAAMRLRAEYLYNSGRRNAIHFNLTNGFRAEYSKWAQGYRISLSNNHASWIKKAAADTSYPGFRAYLDFVFNYAGSLSLSKELQQISWADLAPGDMLVIGGSPGHVETVMDIAQNAGGEKVFLLSQSYMPAQEIQILQNPEEPVISPWYRLKTAPYVILTPQYNFSTANLMRWQ